MVFLSHSLSALLSVDVTLDELESDDEWMHNLIRDKLKLFIEINYSQNKSKRRIRHRDNRGGLTGGKDCFRVR